MGMARLLAIGTITLGTLGHGAWAQQGAVRQTEAMQEARERARQATRDGPQWQASESFDGAPRVSVDFSGGTVGEYVGALRRASPAANIVVSEDAASQPAPAIVLRDVPLAVAVLAIEFHRETGFVSEVVQVRPIGQSGTADATAFRIDYRRHEHAPTGGPRQDASAWSVADLLTSGYSSAEVLAAVQVGQTLFSESATIKYHEPTRLLIVRGTAEQLNLVSRTLDQLRVGKPGNEQEVEARNEIARQQQWLEKTNEQLEPVQTRIVEIRRQLEKDDVNRVFPASERGKLESDLRALEKQREDLLTNRRSAETNIRMAEDRLRRIREQQ